MIVRVAGADARRSLTVLEAAAGIARARVGATDEEGAEAGADDGAEVEAGSATGGPVHISEDDVAEASAEAVLRYDRDGDQIGRAHV